MGGQGNQGSLLLWPSVVIIEERVRQECSPLADHALLLVGQSKKASRRQRGWKNDYLTFQTLL